MDIGVSCHFPAPKTVSARALLSTPVPAPMRIAARHPGLISVKVGGRGKL